MQGNLCPIGNRVHAPETLDTYHDAFRASRRCAAHDWSKTTACVGHFVKPAFRSTQ